MKSISSFFCFKTGIIALLPFTFFIIGYQAVQYVYPTSVCTPDIVGKPLVEALGMLTQLGLSAQLVGKKEDTRLEQGTVLNQIPHHGRKVKPHQTVFLVVSERPTPMTTPDCSGMTLKEVVALAKELKIRYHISFLYAPQSAGMCIAQLPAAGKPLPEIGIVFYVAAEKDNFVLFPDFEGIPVNQVIEFLKSYGMSPTVFHVREVSSTHNCMHCLINEQKPLAGSFVDLSQPMTIHLKV